MTPPNVPDVSYGIERQLQIYQAGLRGERPTVPVSPEALEMQAKAMLPPEVFDYVAGGAGSEETVRANREAFRRWRLVPRMLRDIARRDLSISLFGTSLAAPVLLAPIGLQSVVNPEGELAVARAAASLQVPLILSSLSTHPLEAVAEAMQEVPHWMQLYWPKVPELLLSFVSRAERAGYSALVLTVDAAFLGWRERDLQNAYLPSVRGEGLANYFSDPVFRQSLSRPPEEDPQAAVRQWAGLFSNPSVTWEDLAFLRRNTRLPLLLKGILHPDDARRAVDCGVDGVMVSNHGGRQADGTIAALEALPDVLKAVEDQVPVLFDSGIRRGADAIRALALGARAVLLGRPYIWGLALAGEAGVREVLLNFLADLDNTLAQTGHTTCEQLNPSLLQRADLLL